MNTLTKVKVATFAVMLLAAVIMLTTEKPQALAQVQSVVNVSVPTLERIAFGLAMLAWAGVGWQLLLWRRSRRTTK